MKKICVIILVLLQFCVFATGTNKEWMSFGGEYSSLKEKQSPGGTDITTTLNSIGLVSRSTRFKEDKERGLFTHLSLLVPLGGELSVSGSTIPYSMSEVDFKFHISIMGGPLFRRDIDETLHLYVGIGPILQELAVMDSQGDGALSFILGIGADVGVNYLLTDTSFLNIGVMTDYSFACYTFIDEDNHSWNTGKYSNVSLRPYVGLGFIMDTKR